MDELQKIICRRCSGYIDTEKKLFSDGLLDSLGMVSLIMDIEEYYHIEIPVEMITEETFDTIDGIYEMIQKLQAIGLDE